MKLTRVTREIDVKGEVAMNASGAFPATIQIRRSRLLGLIGGVAALAAAVTWAALAFGVGSGTRIVSEQEAVLAKLTPSDRHYVETVSTMTPAELRATYGSSAIPSRDYVDTVTKMTPAELQATFGTDVDVIDALKLSPSSERSVRAVVSMTPAELRATFGTGSVDAIDILRLTTQAERYVRSILSLTPAELRAAFGAGTTQTSPSAPLESVAIPASGYLEALDTALGSPASRSRDSVDAITKLTPAELQATFGTGDVDEVDTLKLSPRSERYVRAVASLTPAELRAAFGTGH